MSVFRNHPRPYLRQYLHDIESAGGRKISYDTLCAAHPDRYRPELRRFRDHLLGLKRMDIAQYHRYLIRHHVVPGPRTIAELMGQGQGNNQDNEDDELEIPDDNHVDVEDDNSL